MARFFSVLLIFNIFAYSLEINLKSKTVHNETAYITSQCYTKTEDSKNKNILYNPCFGCHTKNKEPNYTLYDDDLQLAYDFPSPAFKNPWTNLFKDRTEDIQKISDVQIMEYVRESNYKRNDEIILKKKLSNLSEEWDFNDNGKWDGYIPDCHFDFDKEGFDKDPKGEFTGWRSFAYHPFLGTFWPTNGSTDDVLIRLEKAFQEDENGNFNKEVYKLNLSIIEALIKQETVNIDPVDEKKYGVDLNQNGELDFADRVVFKWETPKYNNKTLKIEDFTMSYVGKAKDLLISNDYLIAPGLYPKDTEFIHSVRYIDIDQNGEITMAARMKELRYGKKTTWHTYFQLSSAGMETVKEKEAVPDNTEVYVGDRETGLSNKIGWYFQGFIEDKKGELRPQSYEETMFCMGCHSNVGATADSTFVFQRKLGHDSFQNGWYHWSQKGLKGIPDKILKNGETEYVRYLKTNNGGDEFRQNEEVMEKFFRKNWKKDDKNIQKELLAKLEDPAVILDQYWKLKENEIKKLRKDISHLILPSKERAIKLNKAYKVIVEEQSYIYGRDTHIKPANNVHRQIKEGQMTQLEKLLE